MRFAEKRKWIDGKSNQEGSSLLATEPAALAQALFFANQIAAFLLCRSLETRSNRCGFRPPKCLSHRMGCLPTASKMHNFRAVFVGTCWRRRRREPTCLIDRGRDCWHLLVRYTYSIENAGISETAQNDRLFPQSNYLRILYHV